MVKGKGDSSHRCSWASCLGLRDFKAKVKCEARKTAFMGARNTGKVRTIAKRKTQHKHFAKSIQLHFSSYFLYSHIKKIALF